MVIVGGGVGGRIVQPMTLLRISACASVEVVFPAAGATTSRGKAPRAARKLKVPDRECDRNGRRALSGGDRDGAGIGTRRVVADPWGHGNIDPVGLILAAVREALQALSVQQFRTAPPCFRIIEGDEGSG